MVETLLTAAAPSFLESLRAVPRSERREHVASYIIAQFRESLLMAPDEKLDVYASYFDLGLTSLGIETLKQRFAAAFDHPIDATALFNNPTVAQLIDMLAARLDENLADSDALPDERARQSRDLVAELLGDLYETKSD